MRGSPRRISRPFWASTGSLLRAISSAENDREGVSFHNGLYSSIFSNSLGTTMHWTWGSYVDEYNLYSHYRAVNTLFKGADLRNAAAFDNLSVPRATA